MFPQLYTILALHLNDTPERSLILRKVLVFFIVIHLFFTSTLRAQLIPPQSVATTNDVFAIRTNPAGLVLNEGFQFGYLNDFADNQFNYSSFYFSSGREDIATGFSFFRQNFNNENPFRYRFVSSNRVQSGLSIGYGIDFGKSMAPMFDLGFVFHPARFISLGAAGANLSANNGAAAIYRGGVGLRPLGNRFSVSADIIYSDGEFIDSEFQLSTEIIDGLQLKGYYRNESQVAGIGIGINFNHHGVQGFQDLDGTGIYSRPVGAYHYSQSRKRSFFRAEEKQRYIKIEIDGLLVENKPENRFLRPRFPGRTVTSLVLEIQRYSQKADIDGLILDIKNPRGGIAKYQEIRRALLKFKLSGKRIIAYMDQAGNGEYYLASAADKIYLNPAGGLWLTGASVQLTFAKDLLEKIGVAAEFIHTGEYKTAGNMFSEDSATAAQLEQLNRYLDDYYDHFTSNIADSRGLSQDSVKSIVDSGPHTPQSALELGMVDSLLYEDELKKLIEGDNPLFSSQVVVEAESYHRYDMWQYDWEPPVLNKIAVIYATGAITMGESNRSPFSGQMSMGAETMRKAIQQARDDNQVKAIVLRIDSPGGSSLASDLIWRELHRTVTGDNPKPVIVSMSDAAASGGYYIATPVDSILVNPGTVTGSIGVIASTVSFGELYKKVGINTQILKRGENADFLSGPDSLSHREREKIRALISDTYDRFVDRVSDGRSLAADSVYALAQGRIYSGEHAVEVGLADRIGGIEDAIILAKKSSDIPEEEQVKLVYMPSFSLGLFDIIENPGISAEKLDLPDEIMKVLKQVDQAKLLANEQVLYMLPFIFDLQLSR